MTIKIVEDEVRRFLSSPEPEVLCITGKWGVGKTFSWRTFFEAAQANGSIKLGHYAYTSLFGVNSLNELRHSIIENTLSTEKLKLSSHLAVVEGIIDKAKQWRQALPLLKGIPKAEAFFGAVNPFLFMLVRDQIVCVDDLERRGSQLNLKDVLGLVSFLREQRDCKVVLLLNDEKLDEEARKDFNMQLEKVADTRIAFAPTPEEAAQIGLSASLPFYVELKAHCVTLGITNIRVIKKIERACKRLAEMLSTYGGGVQKQAVHSAALFGWSHYEPETDQAPSLDFLRGYSSYSHLLHDRQNQPDLKTQSWRSLLAEYGFMNVDEFDLAVISGIQAGYFDAEKLNGPASTLSAQIEFNRRDGSFNQAWDLYHSSWAPADQVLGALADAFRAAVDTITPLNLGATIRTFKELGRPEEAKELLAYYMSHKTGDRKFFDLQSSPFGGEVSDLDVRTAFEEKRASFQAQVDPREILLRIGAQSGWNPEDLTALASVSIEEYRKLFEESDGLDLRRLVNAALDRVPSGGVTAAG
jgi:hypothetical protein